MALGIAADADTRERVVDAGELVQQVAGLVIRPGGRRGVAADGERLSDACGGEAVDEGGELAPPTRHLGREMRDHFVAARREALGHVDRASLSVGR